MKPQIYRIPYIQRTIPMNIDKILLFDIFRL